MEKGEGEDAISGKLLAGTTYCSLCVSSRREAGVIKLGVTPGRLLCAVR